MIDLVSSRSDDVKQRQLEQRAWPPKSAMSDEDPRSELTDESEKSDSPEMLAVAFVVGAVSEHDQ